MEMITQLEADRLTEEFITALSDKKFYQVDAAKAYRDLLIHRHRLFDWQKINTAIISKWSMAGLKRVKEMAWKMLYSK